MRETIILSNNPHVLAQFPSAVKVNGTVRQVLVEARDRIHQGMVLVGHPLAGSVKPNQTPYKTLILTTSSAQIDVPSLDMIESAINVVDKLRKLDHHWTECVMADFRLIDLTLFQSAIDGLSADLVL